MAGEKREQNSTRQNNGGAQPSTGGRGSDGGAASMQQAASDLGNRMKDGVDDAREQMAHTYRRAEGMVARHPSPSLAASFGLGFGLGILVALVLSQREESWAERHLPDSWLDLPDRLRHMRMPDSVARHMPSH